MTKHKSIAFILAFTDQYELLGISQVSATRHTNPKPPSQTILSVKPNIVAPPLNSVFPYRVYTLAGTLATPSSCHWLHGSGATLGETRPVRPKSACMHVLLQK